MAYFSGDDVQPRRVVACEMKGGFGESIHLKKESHGWGKAVADSLAHDLQTEFPGRNGFLARNLWNMRDFYLEYVSRPKLQPLVAEIGRIYSDFLVDAVTGSVQDRAAKQGLN